MIVSLISVVKRGTDVTLQLRKQEAVDLRSEEGNADEYCIHSRFVKKLTQQGRNEKLLNWYFKGDLFMRLVFSRQCFIQVNVHLIDLER